MITLLTVKQAKLKGVLSLDTDESAVGKVIYEIISNEFSKSDNAIAELHGVIDEAINIFDDKVETAVDEATSEIGAYIKCDTDDIPDSVISDIKRMIEDTLAGAYSSPLRNWFPTKDIIDDIRYSCNTPDISIGWFEAIEKNGFAYPVWIDDENFIMAYNPNY